MKDIEKHYMQDLVYLLKEKNDISKKLSKTDDLELGKHMAYHDVLSLIYEQAIAFNIDLADVGMEGYNPDRDVL